MFEPMISPLELIILAVICVVLTLPPTLTLEVLEPIISPPRLILAETPGRLIFWNEPVPLELMFPLAVIWLNLIFEPEI